MMQRILKLAACLAPLVLAVGCAGTKQAPYDYTAFKAAKPRSILVLPPVNNSPEVNAGNSVYAQVTYPLAEAGYYVLPVALVNETFKQIINSTTDQSHPVAGVTSARLLSAGLNNGILYGPRSANYQKQ